MMMKSISVKVIAMLFCLLFVFGLAGTASALTLDKAAAITVQAERTTKLGAAADGVLRLPAKVGWVTGAQYASPNYIRITLPAADLAKFSGTWVSARTPGSVLQLATFGPGDYVRNALLATAVPAGGTLSLGSNRAALAYAVVDLGDVVGVPKEINLTAQYIVGAGIFEEDNNLLIKTLTQYSSDLNAGILNTIDVVGTNGVQFVGGLVGAGYSFRIISATGFATAPSFGANDRLLVTLSGTNALQGLANVRFQRGAVVTNRAVNAAGAYTLSNVALNSLNGNVGQQNVDIQFDIRLVAAGTSELLARKVSANAQLILQTTGNDGTTPVLNYNLGTIITANQNGSLYRTNFFKSGTVNHFYKFANSGGSAVDLELRYRPDAGAAPAEWTLYGSAVPGNGQLTINRTDVATLLGLGATYSGFLEFRIKTAVANVTAMVNAVDSVTGGRFNIPMYQYDPAGDLWFY